MSSPATCSLSSPPSSPPRHQHSSKFLPRAAPAAELHPRVGRADQQSLHVALIQALDRLVVDGDDLISCSPSGSCSPALTTRQTDAKALALDHLAGRRHAGDQQLALQRQLMHCHNLPPPSSYCWNFKGGATERFSLIVCCPGGGCVAICMSLLSSSGSQRPLTVRLPPVGRSLMLTARGWQGCCLWSG
eukprot:764911-Hanusia_phi.AAC.2